MNIQAWWMLKTINLQHPVLTTLHLALCLSPSIVKDGYEDQIPLYIGVALAALVFLLVFVFMIVCIATRRKRQGTTYSAGTTGSAFIQFIATRNPISTNKLNYREGHLNSDVKANLEVIQKTRGRFHKLFHSRTYDKSYDSLRLT